MCIGSATLWVKAQHEGALPPPCIVRKDPRGQTPVLYQGSLGLSPAVIRAWERRKGSREAERPSGAQKWALVLTLGNELSKEIQVFQTGLSAFKSLPGPAFLVSGDVPIVYPALLDRQHRGRPPPLSKHLLHQSITRSFHFTWKFS